MKAILFASISVACAQASRADPNATELLRGAGSDPNAAALLESVMNPPDVETEQAFCCETATDDGTGSGCAAIGGELINRCNAEGKTVLFCGGTYRFGDGKVTCID